MINIRPQGVILSLLLFTALIVCNSSKGNTLMAVKSNFINIEAAQQTASMMIIGENNVIKAVSSPLFISPYTLSSLALDEEQDRSIIKYTVKKGETISQIADSFNISVETIFLANELTSSKIVEGQELTILPVSGALHMVEKGETISSIAKEYNVKSESIVDYNNVSSDIYVGDILIVPNAKVKKQQESAVASSTIQQTLPSSYLIVPTIGIVTQGAHFSHRSGGYTYYNAVDIGAPVGTPVVAAAGGEIKIIKGPIWPYGNYIAISHPNGITTLYIHLSAFAKGIYLGKQVSQGEIIGYVGNTGNSTGSHLHFEVRGADNPLKKYKVGTKVSY